MLRCADLIRRPPVSLPETATIRDVARELARSRVGIVVLTSRSDPRRPVAVISERDVVRAAAEHVDLERPAIEVARKPPVTALDTDPIWVAAERMREHKIRHLVVVNRDGELVGVISVRDLCFERAVLQELTKEEYTFWG
jgi:CBS domain-containing protein